MDVEAYSLRIVEALKPINPIRIILFGSNAAGMGGPDSDLDILVVLNSSRLCANYEERLEERMTVQRMLFDVSSEIPVDLLVYTKAEFEELRQINKYFVDEMELKGRVLYEKAG